MTRMPASGLATKNKAPMLDSAEKAAAAASPGTQSGSSGQAGQTVRRGRAMPLATASRVQAVHRKRRPE
jgi:hypothetical protein